MLFQSFVQILAKAKGVETPAALEALERALMRFGTKIDNDRTIFMCLRGGRQRHGQLFLRNSPDGGGYF